MNDPRLPAPFPSAVRAYLARLRDALRAAARHLRRHAQSLLLTAAVFAALVPLGGLSPLLAGAGFLVMAMVAAGRGSDEPDGPTGEGKTGEGKAGSGFADKPPRQAQTAERSEPDAWRLLLDAVPDAAVALDPSLNILHFNARLGDLFPRVRVGQPLSLLSRNPELNGAVEKALATSEAVVVDLYERVPVERRISATVSRLGTREARRGLPLLIVSFRDLSEQDKLIQMRADFIANASHELRTPLASLRGFVETLQGPARDDPAARERFLAIMSSQATRMTRLIDDLLSLSRVEMKAHLPPRGSLDLNEVASYVAQALEPVAAPAGIEIVVTKSDGPLRIRGDRDEIVQVLQNLVHNAIKYGRAGGRVEVAVSRVLDGAPPQPRALLAVADDGIGIAPEHIPRLTERFYRANAAASREKGGTGLGLAIVKHIVIRHRGELRISSEVGTGSTFSILFDELGTRT